MDILKLNQWLVNWFVRFRCKPNWLLPII